MEKREDKKGEKEITFIAASCSTLCDYVRRQAEDAKEKVCVRWNATIKFDPTGYKFSYDFVKRNVYQNRSQLYDVMKNVRKKKKEITMGCVFDLAGKTYTRRCASFERAENYILFYISSRPESYVPIYIYIYNRRRFLNTWSRVYFFRFINASANYFYYLINFMFFVFRFMFS